MATATEDRIRSAEFIAIFTVFHGDFFVTRYTRHCHLTPTNFPAFEPTNSGGTLTPLIVAFSLHDHHFSFLASFSSPASLHLSV
jgi:hypothetical protein